MFRLKNGTCLLAAILVLAVMILPGIISVSETALNAVPPDYEAGQPGAGGHLRWRRCSKVSLPAAKSGIGRGRGTGHGPRHWRGHGCDDGGGQWANMPGLFKA